MALAKNIRGFRRARDVTAAAHGKDGASARPGFVGGAADLGARTATVQATAAEASDMGEENGTHGPKELGGVLFALVGGIGWGFSGACAQFLFGAYGVDPLWATTMRLLGAGVVLMALCLVRFRSDLRALWTCPRDVAHLVLFALAGLAFCQAAYLLAIENSNAGTATVLQYIGPVFIVVFSCFKGRKLPSPREATAVAFVAVGTFLIATHGNPAAMVLTPAGLTWGLFAALGVALYSLLPVNLMLRYGSVPVVGSAMLVGGVVMCCATRAWTVPVELDAAGWVALLGGLVVIGTAVGYTFYLQGVNMIGASKASLIASVETVSATLFAVVWLGTAFSWIDIVGFAFIMATVFLLAKRQ